MKKLKVLMMLALTLTIFNACQKDDLPKKQEMGNSTYVNEYGKYQKEVIVYDKTGENSLFLKLHSDYAGAIENYLETMELNLVLDHKNDFDQLKSETHDENPTEKENFQIPNEAKEREVSVELITENIKENVQNYFLYVKQKEDQLKSATSFQFGSYASYKTTGDFIGVVHQGYWDDGSGDEYDIYVYLEKTNSWLAGWDILWQGLLDGWIYSLHYFARIPSNVGSQYYKIGAGVYLDARTNKANYYVPYSLNNFRGRFCSIGSYDTSNCYVGTAPSGTTAFMWPDAQGNFYYTPINGNQCPYPGSSFDGSSCFVIDIPSDCIGFLYNNSWYVEPDIIYL